MKAIDIGELHWKHGNLTLIGWRFDWEDQAYTDYTATIAQTRCALEIMLDNVSISVDGGEQIPFEVERIALDAIGYAAVTSSPSMLREYELSQKRSLWTRVTDWWLR